MQKVTVLRMFQIFLEKVAIFKMIQITQKNTDLKYTYPVIKYGTLIERLEFDRTRKRKHPLIFY